MRISELCSVTLTVSRGVYKIFCHIMFLFKQNIFGRARIMKPITYKINIRKLILHTQELHHKHSCEYWCSSATFLTSLHSHALLLFLNGLQFCHINSIHKILQLMPFNYLYIITGGKSQEVRHSSKKTKLR